MVTTQLAPKVTGLTCTWPAAGANTHSVSLGTLMSGALEAPE